MALTFSFVANEIYAAWMTSAKLDRTIGLTQDSEIAKNQKNIINAIYLTISDPLGLKNRIGERICVDSEKAGQIIKGHKPHREIIKHCLDNALETNMPTIIEEKIIRYLDPNKIDALIDHLQKAVLEDSSLYSSVKKDILEKASRSYLPMFLMRVIQYSLNKWNISEDMVHSKVSSYVNQQPEPSRNSAKIVSRVITPVSKENYVPRPDIEHDIRQSVQNNRILVVRAISGYGKSEVVRHVISQEKAFITTIRMEFKDDGSKTFEQLIEALDVPDNNTDAGRRECLQSCKEDTIIVVDNYNDIENDAFERLCRNTGSARIVFTSQISKEALEEHCQEHLLSYSIIDLEDKKYNSSTFAPAVFCKYAGLSYESLSDSELVAVAEICDHISNHTMLAAALGTRIKEYDETISNVLRHMQASVSECLSKDLPVKYLKDYSPTKKLLTPYEILKKLFNGLLSRCFDERTRQILGAVILLPQQYRKRRVLEELIGDLTEHEARGKVNNLLPENILQLATDETLELHPLYAQLFSDPTIKYCDNTGAEHEGPIAELSIDFRFHLLNNLFVSSNITHNNTLCIYRKLGEELGLSDPKNNIDCSSSNNGWYGVFALYGINAKDPLLFRIHSAIESNHADLEDNLAVSVDELENIFCDHKYDDYDPTNLLSEDEILEIASAYGIDLGAVNGAELDIDEDLVPLSEDEVTHNLTEKDFSPWWHPKQPSFFVIVTGETGASIWIVNYVTKQEYCVLNLHSQRCADARYFNANKSTVPCTINTMLSGSIVEFLGGCIPQYLYVPGCIANGIPIQFVSACGSRDLFDDNCEIICFPPEIKSVCDIEHFSPPKRMVFLGEGVSIKDAPFCMSGEHIEGVILPDEVERLGDLLFSVWNTLDHLVIPSGTITDIRYPGKELYERSILIEGKCFLPIQMVNGTTVHYDTDNILDALCSESMEMPTIYDRTNRYCLDWEKIHSLFADKPIFSLSLKIGVEIFLDDQGNIRYSQEVVHKYPWIIYCRDAYISSVPRECKIYTRAKCTDRELREADQVYTEDIISILQYCVNEATECISGGNKTDAQTLLQIAKDLLDAKSSILPQDVDDIRKKISELLIRVQ